MTLTDLGNLGEFVSAVAVVVSLIYLSIQIRQNTRTMRVSSHHATKTAYNTLHVAFGSDPVVSNLLDRGSEDYSQLNREERFRYTMLMRASFGLHSDMFLQRQERLLSDDEWEIQSRLIARALAPPGARTWWEREAENYSDAFRQEVSRILDTEQGKEAYRP